MCAFAYVHIHVSMKVTFSSEVKPPTTSYFRGRSSYMHSCDTTDLTQIARPWRHLRNTSICSCCLSNILLMLLWSPLLLFLLALVASFFFPLFSYCQYIHHEFFVTQQGTTLLTCFPCQRLPGDKQFSSKQSRSFDSKFSLPTTTWNLVVEMNGSQESTVVFVVSGFSGHIDHAVQIGTSTFKIFFS